MHTIILAAYQPATVYGQSVPQPVGAGIAIVFIIGLVIVVFRGIASFSKSK